MKTILITSFLMLILGTSYAKPIKDVISVIDPVLAQEAYINDIPFDTELIAGQALMIREALELGDEAYVDDIPFDTRSIACKAMFCKMLAESVEEEVNDIPFDTKKIFQECMLTRLIQNYESEQDVGDIRFNTFKIANNLLMTKVTEEFRDESEIQDIPYQVVCIISTSINDEPAYLVVKKKNVKRSGNRKFRADDYEYTIMQPCCIEISTPVPSHSTLTRELLVTPGSSL